MKDVRECREELVDSEVMNPRNAGYKIVFAWPLDNEGHYYEVVARLPGTDRWAAWEFNAYNGPDSFYWGKYSDNLFVIMSIVEAKLKDRGMLPF